MYQFILKMLNNALYTVFDILGEGEERPKSSQY